MRRHTSRVIEEYHAKRQRPSAHSKAGVPNLVRATISTAPPRRSAALPAMQEKAVTAGGQTFHLALPFRARHAEPDRVECTYPLPKQVDRMVNVSSTPSQHNRIRSSSRPPRRRRSSSGCGARNPRLQSWFAPCPFAGTWCVLFALARATRGRRARRLVSMVFLGSARALRSTGLRRQDARGVNGRFARGVETCGRWHPRCAASLSATHAAAAGLSPIASPGSARKRSIAVAALVTNHRENRNGTAATIPPFPSRSSVISDYAATAIRSATSSSGIPARRLGGTSSLVGRGRSVSWASSSRCGSRALADLPSPPAHGRLTSHPRMLGDHRRLRVRLVQLWVTSPRVIASFTTVFALYFCEAPTSASCSSRSDRRDRVLPSCIGWSEEARARSRIHHANHRHPGLSSAFHLHSSGARWTRWPLLPSHQAALHRDGLAMTRCCCYTWTTPPTWGAR